MVGTLTQRVLLMGLCQLKASRSTEMNRRALCQQVVGLPYLREFPPEAERLRGQNSKLFH